MFPTPLSQFLYFAFCGGAITYFWLKRKGW